MNKIIKVLLIGIVIVILFKLTFVVLGLIWALLTNKFFWIVVGIVCVVALIIKFWDNILDLIDDIFFEIQYATSHYKKTNNTIYIPDRSSNPNHKDIDKRFYDKLNEINAERTKRKSQTPSVKNVITSITQVKSTNAQNTNQTIEQSTSKNFTFTFTFTFIPGLYTDYMSRKEKLSLEWMHSIFSITLEEEHRDLMGYYGPFWYPSAYSCNICQAELYKTVYPVGKEFQIKTAEEGIWHIKRAFTCPTCERIYAPKPGYRYTESYATYQAKNEPDYREKVTMMGVYGTTEGRQDI
ncbi:hypothetical protein ABE288_20510 [Bacillus salipaludis]|uniref:hypothetical protein n=1 Tax=Bacillus salipaludis TaxID=2547811 RepID=UPI003D1A5A2F